MQTNNKDKEQITYMFVKLSYQVIIMIVENRHYSSLTKNKSLLSLLFNDRTSKIKFEIKKLKFRTKSFY